MEDFITFENIRNFGADFIAILLGLISVIWCQLHKNENRSQNARIRQIENKMEVLNNAIHSKEEAIAVLSNTLSFLEKQIADIKKPSDT